LNRSALTPHTLSPAGADRERLALSSSASRPPRLALHYRSGVATAKSSSERQVAGSATVRKRASARTVIRRACYGSLYLGDEARDVLPSMRDEIEVMRRRRPRLVLNVEVGAIVAQSTRANEVSAAGVVTTLDETLPRRRCRTIHPRTYLTELVGAERVFVHIATIRQLRG
jgi:hypothetical protein